MGQGAGRIRTGGSGSWKDLDMWVRELEESGGFGGCILNGGLRLEGFLVGELV